MITTDSWEGGLAPALAKGQSGGTSPFLTVSNRLESVVLPDRRHRGLVEFDRLTIRQNVNDPLDAFGLLAVDLDDAVDASWQVIVLWARFAAGLGQVFVTDAVLSQQFR